MTSDHSLDFELDTKQQQLSDTPTTGEQLNSSNDDKYLNRPNTEITVKKVNVSDSQQLESSADPHHTADGLSLVSNYNSSSSSPSSNDGNW